MSDKIGGTKLGKVINTSSAMLSVSITFTQTGDGVVAERDPLGPWNRCRDFDEDCAEICDKVHCWLHDPEQGWCPYLTTPADRSGE